MCKSNKRKMYVCWGSKSVPEHTELHPLILKVKHAYTCTHAWTHACTCTHAGVCWNYTATSCLTIMATKPDGHTASDRINILSSKRWVHTVYAVFIWNCVSHLKGEKKWFPRYNFWCKDVGVNGQFMDGMKLHKTVVTNTSYNQYFHGLLSLWGCLLYTSDAADES